VARDKNEAINSCITDMLALEDHIEKSGLRENVLPDISRTIEEVWHTPSNRAPRAEEASVGPSR
jgi:hypothetical protein